MFTCRPAEPPTRGALSPRGPGRLRVAAAAPAPPPGLRPAHTPHWLPPLPLRRARLLNPFGVPLRRRRVAGPSSGPPGELCRQREWGAGKSWGARCKLTDCARSTLPFTLPFASLGSISDVANAHLKRRPWEPAPQPALRRLRTRRRRKVLPTRSPLELLC